MTLTSAAAFFFAVFIFGITPGPGVFAIIARALTRGSSACTALAFGMVVSDVIYLIAACHGLAVIANHWSEFFTIVRVLGAGYLFYLGWKMWHAPIDFSSIDGANCEKDIGLSSFFQGFLISASNPKVILFYIAFLPTFMDLNALSSSEIGIAAALTLISLMAGLLLIAHFASKARHHFQSERSVKIINRSAASIMATAGLLIINHQ